MGHSFKLGPNPSVKVEDAPPTYGESSSHPVTSEATPDKGPPTTSSHSTSGGPTWGAQRACIMLNRTDLLQLVGFPDDVEKMVDKVVSDNWKKGIQRHNHEEGSWTWKLSGRPWLGQHKDAIPSRRLILALITELWKLGWALETSQLFFLYSENRDTLFFKRVSGSASGPPVARRFFGISMAEQDKVRVYDWPNDQVLQAITTATQFWPGGIQEQKEKEEGYYLFKLRGQPWLTYDLAQNVAGRTMICSLLSALDGVGYDLVGSIDMTIGNDARDGDTMIFGSRA